MAGKGYNKNQARGANGRWVSTGGGSKDARGPAKVGRSGPRGGKVGTRAEQKKSAAAQAARASQFRGKTQASSARDAYRAQASAARAAGQKGGAIAPSRQPVKVNATPVAGRQPRIADTLRATLRELAQSDARFYREIEQITGRSIKPQKPSRALPGGSGGSSSGSQRGSVTGALRGNLRRLAQSDAARLREIADITKPGPTGAISGGKRKGVSGSSGKALPNSGSRRRKPRG